LKIEDCKISKIARTTATEECPGSGNIAVQVFMVIILVEIYKASLNQPMIPPLKRRVFVT